jgi:hypothetical protein
MVGWIALGMVVFAVVWRVALLESLAAADLHLAPLAAADDFSELQDHRWTYPAGVAPIAIHIALSQAEPVKHSLMRGGPADKCWFLDIYLKRVGSFPFCRT